MVLVLSIVTVPAANATQSTCGAVSISNTPGKNGFYWAKAWNLSDVLVQVVEPGNTYGMTMKRGQSYPFEARSTVIKCWNGPWK